MLLTLDTISPEQANAIVCSFCDNYANEDFCSYCMEYKGLITLGEWLSMYGEGWEI